MRLIIPLVEIRECTGLKSTTQVALAVYHRERNTRIVSLRAGCIAMRIERGFDKVKKVMAKSIKFAAGKLLYV